MFKKKSQNKISWQDKEINQSIHTVEKQQSHSHMQNQYKPIMQ